METRRTDSASGFRNLLGMVCVAILLSACAFGTDRVKLYDPLTYKPAAEEGGTKVAHADVPEIKPVGGEKINLVMKRIKDNRLDISKIGAKKNSYGMETGKVDVESGIVFIDLFTKNFVDCLELAGYQITPLKKYDASSPADKERIKGLVEAEVRTFWTTMMPGFFTVDAAGDVIFEVRLFEPETNKEIWSEMFRGKGIVSGVAVTKGMYEKSINTAYSEAMKNLYNAISDEKFRKMLNK
jgi:hypothetical protein